MSLQNSAAAVGDADADADWLYLNPAARRWTSSVAASPVQVEALHRRLPEFNETPLVSLPAVAAELGLAHVLVKDESRRFGLPAFKILGAAWAVYRAAAARAQLPPTVSLEELGTAARADGVRLVTCTDGNWGRAVARMAKYLDLPARIFVPANMDQTTRDNIGSEGAEVCVVQGDYDASIRAATAEAESCSGLLVMDTSWPGYEEIPTWVVEGYYTMLRETDRQVLELTGRPATCAVASVGVGSWAQAVTAHYKSKQPSATVVTAEPTAAACLQTSLRAGKIVPIRTGDTIMCGMNCGTVSSLAWPVLRDGVDASVSISDLESHKAVQALHSGGVAGGPCGAAPLATLRKLSRDSTVKSALGLGSESVLVLFCTEGARPYNVPDEEQ
ncbi:putative diaminopropionate ammonia-lyase [Neofusicoccum parvum]|uniref:Diaminopropionate ammonia-lyase n=1 Tax=Neofusicoccum parvum TaxID=310453 RepID=A0ACB5SIH6_9PEZI|nr:putative diaminopropionate ammonia-lyase [Neofusicoccum parvum]GME42839.1 putative diaminopropionate ammonia-lyase [Neofusicoccum parvum]